MTSRTESAAVMVHNKSLIILGGYESGSGRLNSTEIITEDGQVSQGPDMPTKLSSHAVAGLNSTTSIITGGCTSVNCASPLTWYFNHISLEFQPGPSLIKGRWRHASGTIVDQDTNENIVAVVGGDGAFQSTELLISGKWKQGKQSSKISHCVYVFLFRLCIFSKMKILFLKS